MGISSVTGTWEVGDNWPYPKLYFTDYYIMAVSVKGNNLAIYDMTNANNVWTATEKIDLGAKSGIVSVDIATADKYTLITVNKGATKEVYERVPSTGAITLTAVTVIPGGNSCCNLNGQFWIGGLYSTGEPWSSVSKCSIAWGDVGSNIFLPGDIFGTSEIISGYRKMPWDENGNNNVWKVLPLENSVVVYGDYGIARVKNTMVNTAHAIDMKDLAAYGVLSTYAVNGNSKIHCFVDTNYDLNILTSDGLKNLGYRREMKKLTQEIIVSYDKIRQRFYISDGLLCYVFNNTGLYSTHQCVTSIGDYKGILTGFVKANADTKIRYTTTPFDLGEQGMKTIESVETGVSYDTVADEILEGSLYTKYDYKGDYIQDSWTQLNDRGIFTKKLTGREFKISVRGDYESEADFSLSSIKAKIKFSDKRNIRGRLNVN